MNDQEKKNEAVHIYQALRLLTIMGLLMTALNGVALWHLWDTEAAWWFVVALAVWQGHCLRRMERLIVRKL